MAEITKQALVVDNNQSFPNNNNGQITPTVLRAFNTNMIDSTVNQIVYTADSASFNSQIAAISGSTAINTGSLLLTASFDNGTRNLTFTKGNATQFSVNIPDVSGSTLPAGTVSGSSQITALGFVSSSVTGSSLVTGSVSGNVLTFTKGDASTFTLTVATGSAINTGSFATTGSNVFRGNQTISGSTNKNGINFLTGSSAFFVGQDEVGRFIISSSNQSRWMELNNDSGFAEIYTSTTNFNNAVNLRSRTEARGIFQEVGYPVEINGTLSASLQTGYAFVGGADGYSKQVPTASFSSASLVTGSVNVNVLTFTKGDGSTFDLTVAASGSVVSGTISGSAQITAFGFVSSSGGDTGSLMRTGSVSGNVLTFTKGDATTFTLTVETGSGGGSTFSKPSVESISGSLLLTANTFTSGSANLLHLTASAQNQANLVFKNNNTTGDTIISGSNNIFTNPAAVTTGYKRYIGGSNNLYLNNTNGINSQITQSATTVSGARPVMNNNIFAGTGNFSINQAPNTGTHTYSQNIIGGTSTTTINALGFTGSLNLLSNFNNGGTITINAASASVAQIATGISGSGTVDVNQNIVNGGTLTITTPRLAGYAGQGSANNVVAGSSITVTNISSSAAVNASNNITNGAILYTNAAASAIHTGTGAINSCQGAITVNAIGSAVSIANGIFIGGPTITNNAFTGSAGAGLTSANRNLFQGQGHTLTVTGSTETSTGPNFSDNAILGRNVTIFSNQTGAGNYRDLNGCVIGGQNLIVSASNSFALTEGGSAFFGRYNANDGRRNKTGETVFSVGTGISGSGKTGFLIDSGSNTFVEGSLNVSGSTTFNGNQTITGSLTISGSANRDLIITGSAEITTEDKLARLVMSPNSFNVDTSKTISTPGEGYIFGPTGSNASFYLGVFDDPNFNTDVELKLKADSNGLSFNDWDNGTAFDYVPFMTLAPNVGNNPTPVMTRGLAITGSLSMSGSINFATGSNKQAGTAVLDGASPGAVVVSNSLVSANSIIMLTKQTLTNAHMVAVSSKGAGTFTITSNGNGDTDTVGWFIINNS